MAGKRNLATLEDPADRAPAGERMPDLQPLYNQVKAVIIRRIASGEWRPGTVVPSEMRLAAELSVSQGTVRKAIAELTAQNLFTRKQGRGTFVASHAHHRAQFHFMRLLPDEGPKQLPLGRAISLKTARATRGQATRLELGRGAMVHNIVRVRLIGGKPVMFERITLPAGFFPQFALPIEREMPDELYVTYEQQYGVTIVRAAERLKAVMAEAEDARHLGVPIGAPLLEVDRIALSIDGKPVEWRTTRCNTAEYHYDTTIV